MALTFRWNFLLASILLAAWILLSYGVPVVPVLLGAAGAAAYSFFRRNR
jgi:hypothetical protein